MAKHENPRGIPLPRGWPRRVKSAMLNVIALAQYAVGYSLTCCSLENLILTQKTRFNPLWDMALRAEERFPKPDFLEGTQRRAERATAEYYAISRSHSFTPAAPGTKTAAQWVSDGSAAYRS